MEEGRKGRGEVFFALARGKKKNQKKKKERGHAEKRDKIKRKEKKKRKIGALVPPKICFAVIGKEKERESICPFSEGKRKRTSPN